MTRSRLPMNALLQRFSVITGFSLLVILLIANTGITSHQIGVLVDDEGWVAHTREVRLGSHEWNS